MAEMAESRTWWSYNTPLAWTWMRKIPNGWNALVLDDSQAREPRCETFYTVGAECRQCSWRSLCSARILEFERAKRCALTHALQMQTCGGSHRVNLQDEEAA